MFCLSRDARLTLLHTSYWSVLDKAEALTNLTLDDLKTFTSQLKATFKLEGLVQGNYSQDQALDVARRLKNQLQPAQSPEGSLPPVRIRQLAMGEKCCRIASFHPSDSNSVVVNYYQVGATNLHQTAVMEILVVRFFLCIYFISTSNRPLFITEFDGRACFRRFANPRTAWIQRLRYSAEHVWCAGLLNHGGLSSGQV